MFSRYPNFDIYYGLCTISQQDYQYFDQCVEKSQSSKTQWEILMIFFSIFFHPCKFFCESLQGQRMFFELLNSDYPILISFVNQIRGFYSDWLNLLKVRILDYLIRIV